MTLTGQASAASRHSFSKPGTCVLLACAVSYTVNTFGQMDSQRPQAMHPSTILTYICSSVMLKLNRGRNFLLIVYSLQVFHHAFCNLAEAFSLLAIRIEEYH